MSQFKQLIHEIHRRSLWQVLGIYLVGSWLAFQAVQTLTEGLGLPDWVPPLGLVLLIIGLPVVVATAFVQEGLGTREVRSEGRPAPEDSSQEDAGAEEAPESVRESAPSTSAVSTPAGVQHRVFTWRNATVGGVLALALLGLATAGWMAMRVTGVGPAGTLVAKGILAERDRILLSDFENRTDDPLLAEVVTEALRADLRQSRLVKVMEPGEVAEVLERMQRPAEARLDAALAGEVAEREGIKAIIAGNIGTAGTGYVLTARVLSGGDGGVLTSQRVTADDSTKLIGAIDELSRKLRERIGESLRAINGEPPLERVTTGNLEALRKYSAALRAIEIEGDSERGIALLEEAVALDTAFAMAYRKLGAVLANSSFFERERRVAAMTKAFEHRDRLTEYERYQTVAFYHERVTGERDKAITAYRNVLDIDPEDYTALNNLGNVYEYLRDYERAEEFFSRAVAADSSYHIGWGNLAGAQVSLGKVDEAQATMEEMTTRFPGNPTVGQRWAGFEAGRFGYDAAEESIRGVQREGTGSLGIQAWAAFALGQVATIRGRLDEGEARAGEGLAAVAQRGLGSEYVIEAAGFAQAHIALTADVAKGVGVLEAALEKYPLSDMAPLDRPYLDVASTYAAAGRAERARALVDDYEAELPPRLRRDTEPAYHGTLGDIALAEGSYGKAADEFNLADRGWCDLCPLPGLARALDLAGRPDTAIAVYERYVNTPWLYHRIWLDPPNLGPALERLGQLYDEQGDLENAAKYYAMFVELWAEADEELQPRVRAAQARLEEILKERG